VSVPAGHLLAMLSLEGMAPGYAGREVEGEGRGIPFSIPFPPGKLRAEGGEEKKKGKRKGKGTVDFPLSKK